MKKVVTLFLVIIILFTACSKSAPASVSPSLSQGSNPSETFDLENLRPINLVFGTMGLGSQYYAIASAINTVVLPYLPHGSSFDIQTTSSGGPAGFLLVGTGNADISISNPVASKEGAESGLEGAPPMSHVQALVGGLENATTFILFTQNFVDRTGFTTIEQVIEKKYPIHFVSKALGSSGEATARRIWNSYSIGYDDIRAWGGSVTHTDTSNVIDMLKDNRADVCFDNTNMTQPNWMELTLSTKVHYAPLSQNAIDYLVSLGYTEMIMPAGTYNGQVKQDYKMAAAPSNIVVSEKLADEYAYLITKAMCENKDALTSAFNGLAPFDPKTAGIASKLGCKIHPGAKRYFDEVGYPID
jgi:TRAP transporter TAXI family solute receptor